MDAGTKVNVLGVWSSSRVACDDGECELEHFENRPDLGRYHYESGPREGRPGVVLALEPGDRALVRLDAQSEHESLSCDLADLEVSDV